MNCYMTYRDNILFILDSSNRVISYNSAAEEAFPKIRPGENVLVATGLSISKIDETTPDPVVVFNGATSRWISLNVAIMNYPEHGPCKVVTGAFFTNLTKEIQARLKFTLEFDFILEMNLTYDKYHMLSEQNFGEPIVLEKEPLSQLISRVAETMVHPEEKHDYLEFMNLATLQKRIKDANGPLRKIVHERSSKNEWDEIEITIIPEAESQFGSELIMAFFKIKNRNEPVLANDGKERDSLTGLITQKSLISVSEEYLKKHKEKICVVYTDIQHFRFFNKWYSRWQGDRLLKRSAAFLAEMDKKYSTISAYAGGDNFLILTEKKDEVLDYLTQGLNNLISSFDGIEGFNFLYGAYELTGKENSILDAIDYANTACDNDHTKSLGTISWFTEAMNEQEEEELRIMPEIEKAFEDNEFTFYLQPKCSIKKNKIVGAEALVRWKNKLRGMVSPAEFIPVLERNGMVTKLDTFVWEQVCKTLRYWIDHGIKPIPISVNVSRIDIFTMDVPRCFENLVKKYDIDPQIIEIEITESAFVDDIKLIHSVVEQLRRKGFTILIDDFGSGYSSLNILKDVPADVLKMDIKFFDLNEENFEKGLNIISSVIDMSRSINLKVIAEGVETENQISMLQKIGLDCVQGYYYYKPMSISDYENLINSSSEI